MALKANFQKCFQEISEFRKADLFVFNTEINNENCVRLINEISSLKSRKENCILFLTTLGGYPDQAYKLAKFLNNRNIYTKFILFVSGFCKSAGTLLALSADEIIMTDSGELGPLDIQILSEEATALDSTMNTVQSLELLSEQAAKMFVKCLDGIIKNSNYQHRVDQGCPLISVAVAESVAENVVKSILQPISSQIDPQRFVTVYRQAKVTEEYARRLNSDLAQNGMIEFLLTRYPSHGFIIDRDEASWIFSFASKPVIIKPNLVEQEMAYLLKNYTRDGAIINLETAIQNMEDEIETTNKQVAENENRTDEQSDKL